jgi:hypothetical protein
MRIDEANKILSEATTKRRPTEKSVINHNIRDRINITCDEYVIIDVCERMYIKNKNYTTNDVRDRLGYEVDFIKEMVKSLFAKGLLEKLDNESPRATDKWKRLFLVSESDFEEFIKPVTYPNRIIKWTGSKADAKDKYEKAIKIVSPMYLLERKKAYFDFLSRTPHRDIMAAAVFLNVKTRRYSEEWETHGMIIKPTNKPVDNMPAVPAVSRKDLIGM